VGGSPRVQSGGENHKWARTQQQDLEFSTASTVLVGRFRWSGGGR